MALTKVTGDFIKAGSITQGHLHSSHGITTSHITEGDKLFFTNARVDSRIGSLSSSDLSEGTNLYYTDARARAAISATGSLSYNSTTGVMSFTMPAQNTSNITEGTNLYYTDARADARIAAADTGDLSEGTNLYYTDARADARVALIVDSAPGTLNTLNELAAALGDDANFSTTVTNSIALKAPLASPSFTGNATFAGDVQIDTSLSIGKAGGASGIGNLTLFSRYSVAAPYISFKTDHPSQSTVWETGRIDSTDSGNFNGKMLFKVATGSGSASGGASMGTVLTLDDDSSATFAGTIAASGGNSTQWNTAYGWGDHASAGYLTSFDITTQTDPKYLRSNANDTLSAVITLDDSGYFVGSPSYGFRFNNSGDTINALIVDNSGNSIAYASHRAPIFYDSNDTNYYVNPGVTSSNSTSHSARFRQSVWIGDSSVYNQNDGGWGARLIVSDNVHSRIDVAQDANSVRASWSTHTGQLYSSFGTVTGHDMRLMSHNATRQLLYNGYSQESGSYRAPIFYDSNDTNYYVDPASTSNLNTVQASSFNFANGFTMTAGGSNYAQVNSWIYLTNNTGIYAPANSAHIYPNQNSDYGSWRVDGARNGWNGFMFATGSVFNTIMSNASAFGLYNDTDNEWYIEAQRNSYLRLYYNGVEQARADNGFFLANNQLRSPIFYDSNDTNYYVNPASESKIVKLWINNGGASGVGWSTGFNQGSGSNYWNQIQDASVARQRNFGGGGYDWYSSGGTEIMDLNNSGVLFAAADMRSPIFYDSNNTAYYLNPQDQSSMYGVAVRGDNANTGTGNQIFFWGSGNSTTSAIGFKANGGNFTNPTGNGDGYNTYLTMDTAGRGWVFRQGTGSSNFTSLYNSGWILNNGIWQANASMRSPVFYDSNDTGYYMNYLGGGTLRGNFQFAANSTSTSYNDASIELRESNYTANGTATPPFIGFHWGGVVASSIAIESNGRIAIRNNPGNAYEKFIASVIYASSDVQSPIYYDSNDTAYYTDPASTSSLKLLKTGQNHQSNAPRWDTSFYVAQSQHFYAHSSTQTMYLGESNTINIRSVGIASGSLRAPLFYDSNNTAYYADPGSTSNMNAITLVGTLSGQNAYFNQDVGIGFTSGNIGGNLNVKNSAAGQIAAKLELGSSVNSASTGVFVNTTASYASSGMFLHFQSNHISGDDNVLICYLDGDIVNKNNSYTQYSDERLKENIVDATSKLDEIKQIRVRNFNFIGDDLKQIGVVAQELEPIFPALVKEREVPGQEDPIKTVKYSVLVPILIKAMQEQQTIIDDLKSRLETLENN